MPEPAALSVLGLVLFAEADPPPIGRFSRLPGFAVLPRSSSVPWSATATIDGVPVELRPMDDFRPFPEPMLVYDARLSDADRATVRTGRSAIGVSLSPTENPFRDRKRLVKALRAVLGDDGAAAADVAAQRVWTRAELDDEVSHDAELDIEQMYTLHAVTQEAGGECYWLHSHGLAELGAVDFDVLRPHRMHVDDSAGFVRATALASVEGRLVAGGDPLQIANVKPAVRGVDAEEFMRKGAAADVSLREAQEHTGSRVVLCEPRGAWAPWGKPRPSTLFANEPADGSVVFFSQSASARAARRARDTYPRLLDLAKEIADLELPVMAKLGYEVDDGDAEDREHLWFQVHDCFEREIEATLVNEPYGIARMHEGQRGRHPLARLSDWMVGTPLGPITPRALHLVRRLRDERPRIERIVAEHRRAQ
jgi:uncharacterized protein YegJ (DUF2314 family)